MLTASNEALASASEHGWEASTWSAAATTMIAHAALLRADPSEAQRLAADGLAARPGLLTPPLRFVLQVVHGAATFDQGHRANGLAELQQARSELGSMLPCCSGTPRRRGGCTAGWPSAPTAMPSCWSCARGSTRPPAATTRRGEASAPC